MTSDVFEACPECFDQGIPSPLYWDGKVLACPIHGEVTDSLRMAEYRRLGSLFLLGPVPPPMPRVLDNEGSA